MDQIDLVIRGLDALGRLLLKGVHDPDVVADLHGVDDPERIPPVLEHDLHHAAVKALEEHPQADDSTSSAPRGIESSGQVQLADFMWQEIRIVEERISTARTFRVFPGEGMHSEQVADLVTRLAAIGYCGDDSFEVFNDDYQQLPLPMLAQRARASAVWLGEDLLRRSVPLPNRLRLKAAAP